MPNLSACVTPRMVLDVKFNAKAAKINTPGFLSCTLMHLFKVDVKISSKVYPYNETGKLFS